MKKYLKIITWLIVVAVVISSVVGGWLYYVWSSNLPYIGSLKDYNPPVITEFYSSDGEVIGRFSKQRRVVLPLDQIPRDLINAFVAAEDGKFFEHKGLDYLGIIRAFIKRQLPSTRIKGGGSTITQQVARLLLLKNREIKYRRKVREAILSWQIEKHFSKEEILYLYLNEIYLGSGAYGVESAARTFFNKSVSELNIAECAMIGGLYQSPSNYSPLISFEKAKIRQKYTLNRMLEENFITEAQWKEALETEIILNDRSEENPFYKCPYFSEHIRRYIEQQYGKDLLYNGGLKVYTTVNLDMQQKAVAAIQKGLRELDKREGYRGPLGWAQPEEYDSIKNETGEGFNENPPVKDMIVKGIVDEIDDETGQASVWVGSLKGLLLLKDMDWARKPDLEVAHYLDAAKLEKISDALKPGDIILCRLDKPFEIPEDEEVTKAAGDVKDSKDTEQPFDWTISLEQEPIVQGAIFSMENSTGKVRAMVGGYDFHLSQYDRANQARRQPGSSFKPIIYAAALDNGMTPADIILDTPYVSSLNPDEEPWRPENNKKTFYGPTLFRKALISSLNVITIKILKKIGVRTAVNYARKMGIESELSADLSLALGTTGLSLLEITKTYSAFANNGLLAEPYYIERVEDRDGLVLEENHPSIKQVIPEDTAYIITDILKAVINEKGGTGWRARALGRPAAGKTGTTDSLWDAWFIGYTPELVTGVWTGYDNMTPMGKNETGSRAASPIWLYFMSEALKGKPVQDFIAPESVVFVKIDEKTGLLASPYSKETVFQSFKKGTEPTEYAPRPEAPKSGNFSEFDMDFTEE